MSKDTTTDNITRPNFTPQELVVELIKGVVTRAPIEEIRNLIKLGADVNTAGNQSTKPLYAACMQKNRELITLLLDHGADVNIMDTRGGTPLHTTCLSSNTEIATLLLDRGAEINIADRDGETPLYWACNNNKPKIIPLLLERGAEVNLSLLKAFIIRDEHNQIDAIINNPPDEP